MRGEASDSVANVVGQDAANIRQDSAPSIERFDPFEIPGKPWGTETVIANTPKYLAKVLRMRAGGYGALQYHERKDETFYLFSGSAFVRYHDAHGELRVIRMDPGMAFHVPPGAVHQVEAISDCVFFEASTPVFDDRVKVG